MTDAKKGGLSPAMQRAYERLKKVRESKTVSLRPCPLLREEIVGLDGQLEPFRLRYYQVQGVYHMVTLKHMILGDGTGLGKTVEAITALCYLWAGQREQGNKILVVAPKSAIHQWADEIRRFTVGVRPIVIGTEKPDPVATCTCNGCQHEWQTKATGKKIKCPKCKTQWAKPKEGEGGVPEPELIHVEREGPADARRREYEDWLNAPESERVVLIMNYSLMVRDWNEGSYQPIREDGSPDPNKPVVPGLLDSITAGVGLDKLVVIFDEATAFKSKRTKTWETAKFLANRSHRVYGLTATLLKNRLWEGYCIFGVIRPGLFTTQKAFHEAFCFIELKKVGKARIPLIKGYKNLDAFREKIDPYFLGRPKHLVSDELPTLTTREIRCELTRVEDLKYGEALSGVFELGDGEIKDYEDHKALVSLMYCQQVVNSLTMLKFTDQDTVGEDFIYDPKRHKVGTLGSKEEGLLDLVTGELEDEKVIVYTRFASLVPRLQAILKKNGVKSVCITGRENDKARRKNQQLFQDVDSDTNVIFITSAGSEAINLQMAMATIFYDAPWSWGDYVQTIGRMIRIGSPHKGVLVFHLVATRPAEKKVDQKTIDHHVLSLLRKKKGLIDKVLGEAAVGALTFDKDGGDLRGLIRMMQGRQ